MKKIKFKLFRFPNKMYYISKLYFTNNSMNMTLKINSKEMIEIVNIKSSKLKVSNNKDIGKFEVNLDDFIKIDKDGIPIIPNNYYDAFGVSNKANTKEIKKRYIQIAKTYHPDKNMKYLNYFSYICSAYDILKDEEKRAIYDEDLFLKHNKPWIINLYFFNLNIIQFFIFSVVFFIISLKKNSLKKLKDRYYCPLGESKYDITLLKENKFKSELKDASIEELNKIMKKEKIAEDDEYEYFYVNEDKNE